MMNISIRFLLLFFLFSTSVVISQNYRDKVIYETVYPSFQKARMDTEYYQKAKEAILGLEAQYGYETDLKLTLLEYSYRHKDITFFKEQLEILVEKYGYTISFMKGGELYYDAIFTGELSSWFKPMYLKKHFIWLEHNFDKQFDQRKLYDMELKSQAVHSFASKIMEIKSLDSFQIEAVNAKLNEFKFSNSTTLYGICRKFDFFPSVKNFAVIHSFYNMGLYQNLEIKENIERTWLLFEPYIKKAYLKNDIDYGEYRNYDAFCIKHFGFQKYGLITKESLPLFLRNKDYDEFSAIPIENAFFAEKMKREFGWK
ncbi:hypothetical protein FCR2A7T_14420 [Flavobacterium cauense R2A-7]|uniref:Uncharacterized protein n=1 Tax=Flavobacterium cauense R2A-7 TaxID=1341154 RepID=V6S185_9FLAO|nr:hypothetical protein [Flavobacterium cauense]ESU20032.1 hypothetical protein FCR2A7T_14420 [Flavobacterium cauense R2A-7]TWI14828.1 hypothetical protein IP98_00805 [Flavobacterium cauense R2A-7]